MAGGSKQRVYLDSITLLDRWMDGWKAMAAFLMMSADAPAHRQGGDISDTLIDSPLVTVDRPCERASEGGRRTSCVSHSDARALLTHRPHALSLSNTHTHTRVVMGSRLKPSLAIPGN